MNTCRVNLVETAVLLAFAAVISCIPVTVFAHVLAASLSLGWGGSVALTGLLLATPFVPRMVRA